MAYNHSALTIQETSIMNQTGLLGSRLGKTEQKCENKITEFFRLVSMFMLIKLAKVKCQLEVTI